MSDFSRVLAASVGGILASAGWIDSAHSVLDFSIRVVQLLIGVSSVCYIVVKIRHAKKVRPRAKTPKIPKRDE